MPDLARLQIEVNSAQVAQSTAAMAALRAESVKTGQAVDSQNAKTKTSSQVMDAHTQKVQKATKIYGEFRGTLAGFAGVYIASQLFQLAKANAEVDSSVTKLGKSFEKAFGQLNSGIGITHGFASALDFLGKHMDGILKTVTILAAAAIPALVLAVYSLAAAFAALVVAMGPFTIAASLIVAAAAAVAVFHKELASLARDVGLDKIAALLDKLQFGGNAGTNAKALSDEQKQFAKSVQQTTAAINAQIQAYIGGYDKAKGRMVVQLGSQSQREAALQQAKDMADAQQKVLAVKLDPKSGAGAKYVQALVAATRAQRDLDSKVGVDRQADEQQRLNVALQESGLQYEKINEQIEAENVLRAKGVDITSANGQAMLKDIAATQKLTDANQKLIERMQAMKDLARGIGDSFSSAFEDAIFHTKSLGDAIRGLLSDVAHQIFQQTAGRVIANSISGMLSGAFGVKSANGNVFTTGAGGASLMPFANGGVSSGPQTFPMAGGKTGLWGEAGPEAIMPLQRGSDGKLGVRSAGGGGITVHMPINIDASGADVAAVARLEKAHRDLARNLPQIAVVAIKQAIAKQPKLLNG